MFPSHRWAVFTLLMVEASIGICLFRSPKLNSSTTTQAVVVAPVSEPSLRQRLIGTWHDNYRAKRTLTIREDGTATMHCQLQGIHRFFATELLFEEKWTLEGDKFTMRVIGGSPADKIAFVLRLKGDTTHQTVLEVTDSEWRVFDSNEGVEFQWRRETDDRDLASTH